MLQIDFFAFGLEFANLRLQTRDLALVSVDLLHGRFEHRSNVVLPVAHLADGS